MEDAVKRRLETVRFGKAQRYKNIIVLPLLSPADGNFQYRTLGEALAHWEVAITEVSVAGSVGKLKVISRGNGSVLLLEGEELAGAKRNRVLSASVLLREMSETRIPVSCAEHARWSYTSKVFRESGNLMAYGGRSRMAHAVQRSLEQSGSFPFKQSKVRDDITPLQEQACAPSPPSDLGDVFRTWQDELRHCDAAFKPLPDQVGLLAIIDGQPAGMDVVSLKSAYARLHTKLTRSYALEALLSSQRGGNNGKSSTKVRPARLGQAFLEQIMATAAHSFPSIGYGTDFRCRLAAPKARAESSLQPSLIGSALVHKDEVIHAAFFRLAGTDQA